MDGALRDELIAMAEEDRRVREELAETGELFDGYNPRMEAVHLRNATRLEEIVAQSGWPEDEAAADAAFVIVQHAISRPDVMRRMQPLIRDLQARAHVEDRIRVFEGRRQRYGTQLDWDERGTFARLPLEDPDAVDELRAAVGLPPLEPVSPPPGEPVPAHPAARRRAADEWARSVGWRD